jgi:anthranilate phosphoribosyltransferase
MSISQYIKEIGRGKEGARSLNSDQAQSLMGMILDGEVSELELGAFCLAMRIKGETPVEMAGFLAAIEKRLSFVEHSNNGELKAKAVVVIPSYNGARKLPLLTPLLAGLLSKAGFAVLVHGHSTEDQRVTSKALFEALNWPQIKSGEVAKWSGNGIRLVDTQLISPALTHLLSLRRIIGLRNSAHSLVKLMNPVQSDIPVILLSSFTHPEYAISMGETFKLTGQHAMLLRGTEGEPVADPRRTPKMLGFVQGMEVPLQEATLGSVLGIELPSQIDPQSTAHFIQDVLDAKHPIPDPIQIQVVAVKTLSALIETSSLAKKP